MLAALLLFACLTNEPATVETLRKAGFTDIQTTGYAAWACSQDDTYSTGFEATNPIGERVTGAVCCGWMKNCTVRF